MRNVISLDTETTGLDFRHGSKPYLVTIFDGRGDNTWWEWAVDPLTREPQIPDEDLAEIQEWIDKADTIILQNCKFDVTALQSIFGGKLRWDWSKVKDTLLAGHLIASGEPHNLTAMALNYLGVDLDKFEDDIQKATNAARRLARRDFKTWRIAKKGLQDMPSAKGTVWKMDMWLPRAICQTLIHYRKNERRLVKNSKVFSRTFGRDLPDVAHRQKFFDRFLRETLPEQGGWLKGGTIENHPWNNMVAEYANSDSAATYYLYKAQRKIMKKRRLLKLYKERLRILPIVYGMEDYGVTINEDRLDEQRTEYVEESETASKVCVGVAADFGVELDMPKGGNNQSLVDTVFEGLKLDPVKVSEKTGKPSLDKEVLEHYVATLPPRSLKTTFVRNLRNKRKRDTAISYMDGYKRFWRPLPNDNGWFRLYPSLNPTGTKTTRWSSSNPNEQNISKQEGFNLRYCFGPAPGREWWSLDARNIELRLPAYECDEQEMIRLFEQPDEAPFFGSYHLLIASILHPEKWDECLDKGWDFKKKYASTWYQWTKNGNFADQYGAVLKKSGDGTADRAYRVRSGQVLVRERLTKIAELNQRIIAFANENGYVETMPDRTVDAKRGYPLECLRDRYGGIKPTLPLNYHVQGTAMLWMCKSMVSCQTYLDDINDGQPDDGKFYMIMQVHDELVFDAPYAGVKNDTASENYPVMKKICKLMAKSGDGIGVPTPVSIEYHPKNWSEGISF